MPSGHAFEQAHRRACEQQDQRPDVAPASRASAEDQQVLVYSASGYHQDDHGWAAQDLQRQRHHVLQNPRTSSSMPSAQGRPGGLDYTQVGFTKSSQRFNVIFDAISKLLNPQRSRGSLFAGTVRVHHDRRPRGIQSSGLVTHWTMADGPCPVPPLPRGKKRRHQPAQSAYRGGQAPSRFIDARFSPGRYDEGDKGTVETERRRATSA